MSSHDCFSNTGTINSDIESMPLVVPILKPSAPPPAPAVTALLRDLQEASSAPSLLLDACLELVVRWLENCDRAEALVGDFNAMHVAGGALCVLMHRHDVAVPAAPKFDDSALYARLFPTQTPMAEYAIPDIQEFLCNLQTEFNSMYELTAEGYECCVDVTTLLLLLMRRLGFWLAYEFRLEAGDTSMIDVVASDAEGWLYIRPDVIRHVLDVVHAVLSAHRLLVSARLVPMPTILPEFHPVHLEASMDTWWELATVADCPVGGITQYKNKFHFLFHSVTQVIYYHYPSYSRRLQQSFDSIASGACASLNTLPLLMQIEPDIPVLYEHTGAGHRHSCAKHKFAWLVFGSYVVLCDKTMNTYCASDVRHLTVLCRTACMGPAHSDMASTLK